jgi:hypothetical protein
VWLRRLVLKEIADNALDTGADIRFGLVDPENLDLFYIEDDGPGLNGTPEEIASLFNISRPMRSSKLLRLPQRGALGNGLRVVAGAVLASEGSLVVITRNHQIKLRPEANGSTTVVSVMPAKRPIGTRIEIGFGPALPNEGDIPFAWVKTGPVLTQESAISPLPLDLKLSTKSLKPPLKSPPTLVSDPSNDGPWNWFRLQWSFSPFCFLKTLGASSRRLAGVGFYSEVGM